MCFGLSAIVPGRTLKPGCAFQEDSVENVNGEEEALVDSITLVRS